MIFKRHGIITTTSTFSISINRDKVTHRITLRTTRSFHPFSTLKEDINVSITCNRIAVRITLGRKIKQASQWSTKLLLTYIFSWRPRFSHFTACAWVTLTSKKTEFCTRRVTDIDSQNVLVNTADQATQQIRTEC